MLMSDKATAIVSDFHRDYLDMRSSAHWFNSDHDATKYPQFSAASGAPLLAEIDSFLAEVVLKGGSFKDLFLSNVAFVTRDTAALYGLDPTKFTTQPTRVELDASKRPGILTRAGFLSSFSHFASSAPMLRGAFISGRILDIPLGVADPAAISLPPPPGNYVTNREQTEALTNRVPCNSCHVPIINPPGFVMERYNAVGSWQDVDPLGGAIDGTASVKLNATVTKTLSTPLDLMTEIAKLPEAQHHYAEQFVSYSTGRTPNQFDACTVDKLSSNLADPLYTITNLMTDYTQADSFRLRARGN
jgi:hypothetical protein